MRELYRGGKFSEAIPLAQRVLAIREKALGPTIPSLQNRRTTWLCYFATHGLVAGNVEGLGEPSLALTLPKQPTELDDGLLTASEVAQLKLNTDWVVLSARDTAAAGKPGAEALSGLARVFFYAGRGRFSSRTGRSIRRPPLV